MVVWTGHFCSNVDANEKVILMNEIESEMIFWFFLRKKKGENVTCTERAAKTALDIIFFCVVTVFVLSSELLMKTNK